MKTLIIIALTAATLCGCKQHSIDWQYEKVQLPDDPFKATAVGNFARYSIFIEMREAQPDEKFPKGYIEFENQTSPIDILNTIGGEGWELAWMAPDQKTFYVKRPRAKLGNFILQEKFVDK